MAGKTTSKSSAKPAVERQVDAPTAEAKKTQTYKAIETFKDIDGHIYTKGSNYPAEGKKAKNERIHQLLTSENRMNRPFIEEETEG